MGLILTLSSSDILKNIKFLPFIDQVPSDGCDSVGELHLQHVRMTTFL